LVVSKQPLSLLSLIKTKQPIMKIILKNFDGSPIEEIKPTKSSNVNDNGSFYHFGTLEIVNPSGNFYISMNNDNGELTIIKKGMGGMAIETKTANSVTLK
jgi:hypothetical protein